MKLGQFDVLCDNCNYTINDVVVELDQVSSSEEAMGPEYQYEGIDNFTCPQCGNEISISIEAWEYPQGALNSGPKIKITGGEPKTIPYVTFEE